MPKGFVIAKWTEDEGLIIVLNYPETITVDLDDMMRVFYAHITGAGEAGNVLVRLEKLQCNVASHFTGLESEVPLMINLMLELGEDPDMFGESVIREMNEMILNYCSQMGARDSQTLTQTYNVINELKEYLKNSLMLLDRLKSMSKEQMLAKIYSSRKGIAIMKILQERARSRKELQNLLEDLLGQIISNIELTLDPFFKTSLVKQDWIEGLADIFLFILSDFTIMRSPSKKMVEDAKKNRPNLNIAGKYLEEVNNFFIDYRPSFQDNRRIAEILINPDKYDYISLLRERAYPLQKLPKGSGLIFTDTRFLMQSLAQDKIVTIIEDIDGVEWVFLLTDILVQTFFPEYMLERVRSDFMEKKLKKEVANKHLELLEKAYSK